MIAVEDVLSPLADGRIVSSRVFQSQCVCCMPPSLREGSDEAHGPATDGDYAVGFSRYAYVLKART